MNKRNIGYWAVTGLFGLVYLASGTADILHASPVLATLAHLGYPAYVASILGPWKVAGALTVLAPRMPRVKEWAYAGIIFDLSSGFASHLFNGDPLPKPIVPVVLIALAVTSYLLRPASRRLNVVAEPVAPAVPLVAAKA